MYYVYIIRCVDGTLYSGITTDVERRILEHNSSSKGARYTRSRRPCTLVYTAPFPNRAVASQEEARIKRLSRDKKISFIAGLQSIT